MKKWIVWLLCMMCILGTMGCAAGDAGSVTRDDETSPEMKTGEYEGDRIIGDYEDNILGSGRGWFGDMPNGLRPMLMVNGKLFRWTGMSKEDQILTSGVVYIEANMTTFLPEGYTSVGDISDITEEVPSRERQLRAAFDAEGTIYVNDDTPEVVYVLMTTSWFTDCYMRFVTDELHDNECISYQGRQYRINNDPTICEDLKELPEGCVLIGTLQYIGTDHIPVDDLETNRIGDGYSKYLDGREVYADPDDLNVIYVYEHQYWAQGDYPAWVKCPLWTE